MGRMPVHHQEYFSLGTMKHPLEEVHKSLPIEILTQHHEAKRSSWTDRRNHVQGKSLAGCPHHRSFSNSTPCSSHGFIGSNSGFVLKEYLGILLLGQCLYARKLLLFPSFHQAHVLLIGTLQRSLKTEPKLGENPVDCCSMQNNVEFPLDEFANK